MNSEQIELSIRLHHVCITKQSHLILPLCCRKLQKVAETLRVPLYRNKVHNEAQMRHDLQTSRHTAKLARFRLQLEQLCERLKMRGDSLINTPLG